MPQGWPFGGIAVGETALFTQCTASATNVVSVMEYRIIETASRLTRQLPQLFIFKGKNCEEVFLILCDSHSSSLSISNGKGTCRSSQAHWEEFLICLRYCDIKSLPFLPVSPLSYSSTTPTNVFPPLNMCKRHQLSCATQGAAQCPCLPFICSCTTDTLPAPPGNRIHIKGKM